MFKSVSNETLQLNQIQFVTKVIKQKKMYKHKKLKQIKINEFYFMIFKNFIRIFYFIKKNKNL